jgi:hypothetical protein
MAEVTNEPLSGLSRPIRLRRTPSVRRLWSTERRPDIASLPTL